MKKINVLITNVSYQASAGSFIKLLRNSKLFNCYIVGCDSIPKGFSSGSMLVDRFYQILTTTNDEEYVSKILSICLKEDIDLIISADEDDLELFKEFNMAQAYPQFIPDHISFTIFRDKYIANNEISNINVTIPKTISSYNEFKDSKKDTFIWRKRESSCSRGIKIFDREQINSNYIFFSNNHITQEFVNGDMYTVDVLCDKHGEIHLIIPRKDLAIKDGTTFKCVIEKETNLINLCKKIYSKFCLPGISNIQFIVEEGIPYFIELNPRAAATFIASSLASVNILDLMINNYVFDVEIPQYNTLMSYVKWNSVISRYYEETILIGEK